MTRKTKEVVDAFRKGKFELVALMKTKLKGKGEVSCGVNGIIDDIRARERVAILL